MAKFIGQPDGTSIGLIVTESLAEDRFTEATFVSAFTKRAALSRLERSVQAFRSRGGYLRIITGIDHGGTTKEGLQSASEIADEVTLIHHKSPSITFHPKLFIFRGEASSKLITTSSNLTAGGLWGNFETGVILDTNDGDSLDPIAAAELYLAKLLGSASAVRLQHCDIEQTLAFLPSERFSNSIYSSEGPGVSISLPFGISPFEHSVPTLGNPKYVEEGQDGLPPQTKNLTSNESEVEVRREELSEAASSHGFWKALSSFDVSTTSSPGQIIIPLAFGGLFPEPGAPVTTSSGAEQADTQVAVSFTSEGMTKKCNGRLIFYKPAPNHKRPNPEFRFTFLDRDINPGGILEEDDILVFNRTALGSDVWFAVRHVPVGSEEHASLMQKGPRFSAT